MSLEENKALVERAFDSFAETYDDMAGKALSRQKRRDQNPDPKTSNSSTSFE